MGSLVVSQYGKSEEEDDWSEVVISKGDEIEEKGERDME